MQTDTLIEVVVEIVTLSLKLPLLRSKCGWFQKLRVLSSSLVKFSRESHQ